MQNIENFLKITGALNDESRIKILAFLAFHFKEQGMLCVCDLQESLDMVQSRLSRHLKILKDAGFLECKRQGVWSYYGIKQDLNPFCKESLKHIELLRLSLPELKRISVENKCPK